ncbi:MAG TPA: hypothetical protein DCM87_03200 [Planctomycetes bacterium]|nr:hypothetical protein [Planctomycetota bacterium]
MWCLSVLAMAGLLGGPHDVIVNEIMYRPPEHNYQDEYIELFNRGADDVDMAGWRFNAGVQYEFPAGAVLRGGGYLVVCGDTAYLGPKLGLSAGDGVLFGNWEGHLSNGGERIRLVDAGGATIESLRYGDRPPFPTAADGEGSSLERIAPDADNDAPENWAASEREVAWRELRVRAVPAEGATRLRFFFPARGSVLIDAVEVREEGGGENLIANGDFESSADGWSIVGVYRASRSTAAAYTGNASLSVRATSTAAPGDCAYAELAGLVEAGRTYDLRCVCRMPASAVAAYSRLLICDFLGTESRIFLGNGSPGVRNNSYQRGGLPPVFVLQDPARAHLGAPHDWYAVHEPFIPASTDAVRITCTATDDEAVADVTLFLDTGSGEVELPMYDDGAHGDGLFAGDGVYGSDLIPPLPNRRIVRYRLRARDGAGRERWAPLALESTPTYAYMVSDGVPASSLPVYQAFISTASLQALAQATRVYYPAVLVCDGVVYDRILVRNRGHTSIGNPKKHWHFKFNRDRLFPAFDALRQHINLNSMWGTKDYLREALSYPVFRDIRALPCDPGAPDCFLAGSTCYTEHVRMEVNGAFWAMFMHMEHPDGAYAGSNGLHPDTEIWKAYLSSEDLGTNPQSYVGTGDCHCNYGKKMNLELGFAALADFLHGANARLGQAHPDIVRYIDAHMDVPDFVNYLVGTCLVCNADHPAKNYLIVRFGDTGRFSMAPWDLDLVLGRNFDLSGGVYNDTIRWDNHAFIATQGHPKIDGPWNRVITQFLNQPRYTEMYYARLKELLDSYFTTDAFYPRIEALREKIRATAALDRAKWGAYGDRLSWEAKVDEIKTWWPRRRDYLRTYYAIAPPSDPVATVANDGAELHVAWKNNGAYPEIRVYLDGLQVKRLTANETSTTVTGTSIAGLSGPREVTVQAWYRYSGWSQSPNNPTPVPGAPVAVAEFPRVATPLDLTCAWESAPAPAGDARIPAVRLAWRNRIVAERIEIVLIDGETAQVAGTAPGAAREFLLAMPDAAPETPYVLGVRSAAGQEVSAAAVCTVEFSLQAPADMLCVQAGDGGVIIVWTAAGGMDAYVIAADGREIGRAGGDESQFVSTEVPCGAVVSVRGAWAGFVSAPAECAMPPCTAFIRGDADADGRLSINDVIRALEYLFASGAAPACLAALDANADGRLNVSDPITIVRALFGGGSIAAPYPDCGTAPSALPCAYFTPCAG